jgi:hypothetical protein
VFAEIVLVQRICEWCTVIHLLTLASFLIALTRWQRRDEPALPMPQRAPANRAAQPAAPTATAGRSASSALSHRTRRSLNRRPPTAR